MHCECWILVHCDATIEWERNGKVRKPGYLNALWRNRQSNHMRALVAEDTSDALKRSKVRNCSLCESWWSWWDFWTGYQRLEFNISQIVIASADIWHFVIVTWHSNLNLRPQNVAPGDRCLPFSPWLRHCLHDRIISLLQVMHTAKYPEVEAS